MPNTFLNYEFDYLSYKKRTSNIKGLSFLLLTLLIIILMASIAFLKPIKSSCIDFYFVKSNTFSTYKNANTESIAIQEIGGGGNLYYNNGYNVLVNYYSSKKDCETVCKNLKNTLPFVEVYKIEAKKFKNLTNLTKNQNKSMQNITNFIISSINSLSNISLKIDKNELNFNQASTLYTSIFKDYKTYYEEFLKQFKTNSKFNSWKDYVNNIFLSIQNLANSEELNNQQIKYNTINIVLNYCSLSNLF